MLTIVTLSLFTYLVSACSDCFSNCADSDKNGCLVTCGCPVFSLSGVKSGSFKGASGKIYVPNVDKVLVDWVQLSMDCDLSCSEQCSSQYLDISLEICIQDCGCQNLLLSDAISTELNIENSCSDLCIGSGAGCYTDCISHFESPSSTWYTWLWVPALLIIIILAFFMLRKRKEDDYILM